MPRLSMNRRGFLGSAAAAATYGSYGIRESQDYVRKGGAAARMMLVQAAADEWKVPATECRANAGAITHAASKRRTTYGKVAVAAATLTPAEPATIALKDPKDWKLIGKPWHGSIPSRRSTGA